MSDLPFKLPVRLHIDHDGGIHDDNGNYVSIIDLEAALNRLPLLLSIAEGAEKYREARRARISLQEDSWMYPGSDIRDDARRLEEAENEAELALDTALSAWREGKGKDNA